MKRIIIALCMLYLFGGNLSAKVVLPQILSDHAGITATDRSEAMG